MQPLKKEWLLQTSTAIALDCDDVFSALHERITGYSWSSRQAGVEANNLLSRIVYRKGQIVREAEKLAKALGYDVPGTLARHLAGTVLLDIGIQQEWEIKDTGSLSGIVVRWKGNGSGLSSDDYAVSLRREALAWLDLVLGQLKSYRATTGRFYGRL